MQAQRSARAAASHLGRVSRSRFRPQRDSTCPHFLENRSWRWHLGSPGAFERAFPRGLGSPFPHAICRWASSLDWVFRWLEDICGPLTRLGGQLLRGSCSASRAIGPIASLPATVFAVHARFGETGGRPPEHKLSTAPDQSHRSATLVLGFP